MGDLFVRDLYFVSEPYATFFLSLFFIDFDILCVFSHVRDWCSGVERFRTGNNDACETVGIHIQFMTGDLNDHHTRYLFMGSWSDKELPNNWKGVFESLLILQTVGLQKKCDRQCCSFTQWIRLFLMLVLGGSVYCGLPFSEARPHLGQIKMTVKPEKKMAFKFTVQAF